MKTLAFFAGVLTGLAFGLAPDVAYQVYRTRHAKNLKPSAVPPVSHYDPTLYAKEEEWA